MSSKAKASNFKGYLLVRDKDGKPKFDDIFNIPTYFWNTLTESEKSVVENERLNHNNLIKE